ncbi:SDR family NAD(P)-dependent oxidoreductase [Sorangium sp. So ce269]
MYNVSRVTRVEALLCRHAGLLDCVAIKRRAGDATTELVVAYVVPAPGLDPHVAEQRAAAALAAAAEPGIVVAVDHIPRDALGNPRLDALLEVPVVTHRELQAYREVLAGTAGGGVGVELGRRPVEAGRLRRADVLPYHGKPLPQARTDRYEGQGPDEAQASSVCDGGPVRLGHDAPGTMVEALVQAAQKAPDRGVRVAADTERDLLLTYPQLLERSRRILTGLRQRGVRAGESVILVTSSLEDYFPAVWACLLVGAHPVTVAAPSGYDAPNATLDKILSAWRTLARPIVMSSGADADGLRDVERLYPDLDLAAWRVISVRDCEHCPPARELHAGDPSDTAVLQLSSGTTGASKVIPITHRAIVQMAFGARERSAIDDGDVSLNWLPLDHVGALVWAHLRDVVLRLTNVHVSTTVVLAEPLRWLELMARYRARHTWSPNFGYRLVADALAKNDSRGWDLSGVKSWLCAGEQCTLPVIQDFLARTAPFGVTANRMLFSFGMAETSTGVFIKNFAEPGSVRRIARQSLVGTLRWAEDDADPAACVTFLSMGAPLPGVAARIVDDSGADAGERRIGRLQIRSERVTPGYLNNDEANREVFREGPWFDTGDLAFATEGEIIIVGRSKETIIINGVNHYCHAIEDALGAVDGVRAGHVAVCSVTSAHSGSEELAVFFVPESDGAREIPNVVGRIRAALTRQLQLAARYVIPISAEQIPRTTAGKIQRGALRERLLAGDFDPDARHLRHADTVSDCVFTMRWIPVESRALTAEATAGTTVVVVDDVGLADCLLGDDHGLGDVVTVRQAQEYQEAKHAFHFNLGAATSWERMFRALIQRGRPAVRVIYARSYLPMGAFSTATAEIGPMLIRCGDDLLACYRGYQAVASVVNAPLSLVTVSCQLYRIDGNEQVCVPAAVTAAIAEGIPHETSHCWTRHIDLGGTSSRDDARDLSLAIREASAERHLAWRHTVPHVPRLMRAPVAPSAGSLPVQPGGCYLVTGGLGGIGAELLQELLSRYRVRALVVGRTRLDGADPASAARRDAFAKLSACGDLQYAVADVGDRGSLERAVAGAEASWGQPMDGVLHLAGNYQFGLLTDQDKEQWDAALHTKTMGSMHLAALLETRPGARFIAFSSLFTILGAAGCASYAAANRFLEAFCEHLRSKGVSAHCLNWSRWSGVGMAGKDGSHERDMQRGILPLSPSEARTLALAMLSHAPGTYLIGLNPDSPALSTRVVGAAPHPLRTPVFIGPVSTNTPLPELRDMFGRPVRLLQRPSQPAEPRSERETPGPSDGFALTPSAVRDQIIEVLRDILGRTVDPDRHFHELGLGSIHVIQAGVRLRQQLHRDFPVAAFFEYPTADALASFLTGRTTAPATASSGRANASAERRLAIIGMAVRFPGAPNLDAYWANIRSGAVSIRRPTEAERPRRFPLETCGPLDDIDRFDAEFFGMHARVARGMEPQQRLLLECCYHALEHAGYVTSPDLTPCIGLYVGGGSNVNDLRELVRITLARGGDLDDIFDVADNNTMEYAAARIAQHLGLTGPCVNVQTASSTGLTAVHLAGQAVLNDDADLALAAVGVAKIQPFGGYKRMASVASKSGRSVPFDESGDGCVKGSGIAAVVLKRLDRAIADGDAVHAVILGSAITNDGADRPSFTSPSIDGQARTITSALRKANVSPEEISYVEAQGTGTPVGDLVEFAALTKAFQRTKAETARCPLGSVSANIGHVDHCSGLAALIKTVLMLQNREIPPMPGFTRPRPAIDLATSPFFIPTRTLPWAHDSGARRAGVSAFGTGGMNAYCVLEEAPLSRAPVQDDHLPALGALPISARTGTALAVLAARYRDHLRAHPAIRLEDLILTAGLGRRHLPYRLTVLGTNATALADALDRFLADPFDSDPARPFRTGNTSSGAPSGPLLMSFLGSNTASSHAARTFYRTYPIFRDAIDEAEGVYSTLWGKNLRYQLLGDGEAERAERWTASALLALHAAWLRLWRSLGASPAYVMGSGGGTCSALHAAGALTLHDALYLAEIYDRSPRDTHALSAHIDLRPLTTAFIHAATGSVLEAGATPGAETLAPAEDDRRGTAAAQRLGCRTLLTSDLHQLGASPLSTMATTIAELQCSGVALNWQQISGTGGRRIPLPEYPFEDSMASGRGA